LLDPTFLGSAMCRAQAGMGLASCQTQHSWVQLHAKHKRT